MVYLFLSYIYSSTAKASRSTNQGSRSATHRTTTNSRTQELIEPAKADTRPTIFRLQKTTNGGIILMDVFFKVSIYCIGT